uniref:Uncharacterized protein n=1 Tax=Oryza punctata TaxID=4537 RepID=A0A0E0JFR5_ORYPU
MARISGVQPDERRLERLEPAQLIAEAGVDRERAGARRIAGMEEAGVEGGGGADCEVCAAAEAPVSEGLSESNQLSCTLRLVLRGNGLAPGGSPAWKKLESRAVAPPTAKLAPCRKLPLCDRYGGTNGRPRFRATN